MAIRKSLIPLALLGAAGLFASCSSAAASGTHTHHAHHAKAEEGGGGQAAIASDSVVRWGAFHRKSGSSDSPKTVGNMSDIVQIAAGNGSAAGLDSSGHVWMVGLGSHGDLGQGNTASHLTKAVEVSGLPTIAGISEFQDSYVAWTSGGAIYGWGWNHFGGLCTGNTKEHNSPILLTKLSGIVAAAGGQSHMMYLTSSGELEGCGDNGDGQLGNGKKTDSSSPVTVTGLPSSPIVQLVSGRSSTEVLLANGEAWGFGNNDFGQLGNGTTHDSDIPVKANLPSAAAHIYQGGNIPSDGHTLFLLANGQVWGAGDNANGQLGNGTTQTDNSTPIEATSLPSGHTWTNVAAGGSTSYVLDSTGAVYAFGANDMGQVGNGTTGANVLTPTLILSGVDLIVTTADDVMAHTS